MPKTGRPSEYDERKENHMVRVTPTGWKNAQSLAKPYGGISGMVERLGRGELKLQDLPMRNSEIDLESHINAVLLSIPPSDRRYAKRLFKKLSDRLSE